MRPTMTSFIEEYGKNGSRSKVTGGLMQELEDYENGISGMFDSFEKNGMTEAVERWANGETQPASVRQMERGFSGTKLIDNVAQRTHLSQQTVLSELAVLVPILVHHFILSGFVTAKDGLQFGNAILRPNMMLASALDRVA